MFGGHSAYRWVDTVFLLFLYSYDAYFIQRLLKKNEKKLAQSFNFTFRYIDDYSKFGVCRYCWNVVTYKCKVHNGKTVIISFVVRFRS
jgi:hypothetical protein